MKTTRYFQVPAVGGTEVAERRRVERQRVRPHGLGQARRVGDELQTFSAVRVDGAQEQGQVIAHLARQRTRAGDPPRVWHEESVDVGEQAADLVARRCGDRPRAVEHRLAAGRDERRRQRHHAARHVGIAHRVEDEVERRQYVGLAGRGELDHPVDDVVAHRRKQVSEIDVAPACVEEDQHRALRRSGGSREQALPPIGEFAIGSCLVGAARLEEDGREVDMGVHIVGTESPVRAGTSLRQRRVDAGPWRRRRGCRAPRRTPASTRWPPRSIEPPSARRLAGWRPRPARTAHR